MDYQEAYVSLFRAITKAIGVLEHTWHHPPELAECVLTLQKAQQTTEEMDIESEP